VIEIIRQCLVRQKNIDAEKSVVLFSDISDAGYLFTVRIMIHDLSNGLSIKSQVLSAIHAEFVAKGIRFPRKVFYSED
jgi:small-conductance mechanosensitive channel